MLIRVASQQSLPFQRAAIAAWSIAMSAALLSPNYVTVWLMAAGALALVTLLPMAISRQRTGEANFALVTPKERQRFIFQNSAWGLAMLAGFATAAALAMTSYGLPIRPLVGISAILMGLISHYFFTRTAMDHAARVCPIPSDEAASRSSSEAPRAER